MESEEDIREIVVPLRFNETVVATVSLLAFTEAMILLFWLLMLPTLAASAPIYIALMVSFCLVWLWVHMVETTRGSFEYSLLIEGNKQLGEITAERALPLEVREAPLGLVEDADGRV